MREIKFRVWNNLQKRIIYLGSSRNDTALWIAENFWDAVDHFTGVPESLCDSKDGSVLMQFTGMKDKNGRDIYEGDIVKRKIMNPEWDEIDNSKVPKYKEEISQIIYRNNGFWVKDEGFGWEGEDLWDWDLMEVIGTIYENPNLIKDESETK